ncbi:MULTISPECIES: ogr/Delta-like zinc finger family protein [Stenotrophomonas]|uniref:ogr/Delta-like zinc finger family protein n=1 Tax=Stenotrophomonas TaxID=40323 RepID=UPI0016616A0E|nr:MULTISPECIES: ogr/Delta-like zinc finger family protein [Stenotrophomonas]MBN5058832.1 ogr/Delta-like zinc finger family protein [Stenotrophomonas maltophilia]MBN5067186.1 ogr/Delta-like zinc finger family protein [Stenotrophomonas maltophilia]MCW8342860.1 ogr/Delta-like zinc finger family protein [Stenotrophomonas sp. SG1]UGB19430.1 ogr/Delta-like zinc finger family protein [Stenotrophomonas maltophilia]UGB50351.1 ogr/Delta-like zinc finger family protein [Stenotrophomonas maltophilia]
MSAAVGQRAVFCCPACRAPLVKRTSALQHQFLRTDAYVCPNPMCGATYTGNSELTSVASPSGLPTAPACELPPTPGYQRVLLQNRWKQDRGEVQLDWIDSIDEMPPGGGDLPAI